MATDSAARKNAIGFFLNKGILLSDDILDELTDIDTCSNAYTSLKEKINQERFLVLNKDVSSAMGNRLPSEINWVDLEKAKALLEKGKNPSLYGQFLHYLAAQEKNHQQPPNGVVVLSSATEDSRKRDVQDFVSYFNLRFAALSKILLEHPELRQTIAINKALTKKERENIAIIGMVSEKRVTKNGNLSVTLEDPTGSIRVLFSKNKQETYEQAKALVFDEVVGITGTSADKAIFANQIILPGVIKKEPKKSDMPGYALFLSDLHIGSQKFLHEAFEKLLSWICGESGTEQQREIASQLKYIFIVGDLVDGVGIYPGQEKELAIQDIYDQYRECARLLSKIPSTIPIIICAGNHDAVRLAEPQPMLYNDLAEPLLKLPNVILVSNPSVVNIHSSPTFPGINILLYHGYSFDYYIANVDEIRNNGGYDRADLVMKFLLQRRHLAPTHNSTVYTPTTDKDHLFISQSPDIFVTGHLHKSAIANYKNITLIGGSCFQGRTAFQEKVGHNPDPGKVPAVNLQTREIKVLRFC
ncbi:DNA-directed DNA polymerase II small subunit [Candidatus Woesearchaeota archaeon]|nr:DNA-directed DNA polymerase II small subunit [Candidatus Woesearchaeota archaeon]